MKLFKNLTLLQKKQLLRKEYSDWDDTIVISDELIPKDEKLITARLKEVFGYKDDEEVDDA